MVLANLFAAAQHGCVELQDPKPKRVCNGVDGCCLPAAGRAHECQERPQTARGAAPTPRRC